LPRCRELVLAQIPSLGSSLPRILEWDHVDRLEVLDLSRTTLTPEALRDVLARPFGALRELRLSGNPLGPSGAKVLGEALPRLRSLAALQVVSCGFDDAPLATRATITSRVPDRIAIDLVGTVIELQRAGETWTVLVDGVPRMVRWQSVARGDDRPDRVTKPWQMAKLAPLDTLAGALAGGAIRVPSPDGCVVDLGAQMGYVYNTSVYSRETAELAYDPVKLTLSITFAEYTSID